MKAFPLKGRLVEHGDLLSECKRVQEGRLFRLERERKLNDPLLITGSGVRVPHNPHFNNYQSSNFLLSTKVKSASVDSKEPRCTKKTTASTRLTVKN